MEAGVATHVWTLDEVVMLLEAKEALEQVLEARLVMARLAKAW